MPDHYHYIITGAGCAGSSLLMRMMEDVFFDDKRILVIDQSPKLENDRTWCFWEKESGLFESIIYHSWEKLAFFSQRFSSTLAISPYRYKMIRGIDLYAHVREKAVQRTNIEWRYERVLSVSTGKDKASVILDSGLYTADYVFNSILFEPFSVPQGKYFLWQHFTGWMIQTAKPCFDTATATFMDFRVSQQYGTTFLYLMPVSDTTALVEYTLFTEKTLEPQQYETALQEYITDHLGIEQYAVSHKEFGMIPMTNIFFPSHKGRVWYIGIAGGQAKGSSGYAFRFIQKKTKQLVDCLKAGQVPHTQWSFSDKKFSLYDSVLLHVLHHRKMEAAEIFARIFRKNSPERVLRFLDNESNAWEDLQIMRSLPAGIFLPAAIAEIKRSL